MLKRALAFTMESDLREDTLRRVIVEMCDPTIRGNASVPKPYRRIARPISVPIPLPHAARERTNPTWMNDSPWM